MMRFIIISLSLVLAGCVANTVPVPPPPIPPMSSDPFDTESDAGPLIATRQYLTQDQKMSEIKSPMKGLVLLRKDSRKRNKLVCKAFIALPTTTTAEKTGVPADRITPTVWLVKSKPPENADCGTLLDLYDYDAAAVYYAHLGRESSKGPLLAAIVRGEVAYINLAKASKNDIRALVPVWSKALLLNDGNDIDLDREILREVCQAAGIEPKNVTAGVLAILDKEGSSFWKLLSEGVKAVANVTPFGEKIVKAVSKTCDKVVQRTNE